MNGHSSLYFTRKICCLFFFFASLGPSSGFERCLEAILTCGREVERRLAHAQRSTYWSWQPSVVCSSDYNGKKRIEKLCLTNFCFPGLQIVLRVFRDRGDFSQKSGHNTDTAGQWVSMSIVHEILPRSRKLTSTKLSMISYMPLW